MHSVVSLQLIAVLVTMVMAAGSVCALIWGVWTYRRSADAQLQLLAFQTLQRYLDHAVDHPDLASWNASQSVDARYAWFAAQALTTAQTLWLLVARHPTWQRSINAIVRQHQPYLESGHFVCDDFDPDFVSFLRTRCTGLKCADANVDRAPSH